MGRHRNIHTSVKALYVAFLLFGNFSNSYAATMLGMVTYSLEGGNKNFDYIMIVLRNGKPSEVIDAKAQKTGELRGCGSHEGDKEYICVFSDQLAFSFPRGAVADQERWSVDGRQFMVLEKVREVKIGGWLLRDLVWVRELAGSVRFRDVLYSEEVGIVALREVRQEADSSLWPTYWINPTIGIVGK